MKSLCCLYAYEGVAFNFELNFTEHHMGGMPLETTQLRDV
jgi:hypothetical protein